MRVGIELRQIVPETCGGIVPLLEGVLGALFAAYPEQRVVLACTEANVGLFPTVPHGVERVTLPGDYYFRILDELARKRGLDVLFRSYPLDVPLAFPPERQVVLVPDMQHEFLPELFPPEVLRVRRASFDRSLAEAGAIATLSEHARQTILAHPATRCRDVFLMPPALRSAGPGAAAVTAEEWGSVPRGPFFLYPANLWPHKNHRRLLEAFALFRQRADEPAELVLTGDPTGWPDLAAQFPGLPVRHLGFVPRPLLQFLMGRARALVFFSLFEGFGMPLLEAFDAGTPVVCSSTTSLPEAAGDAALLCDPTDVSAMADALLTISRDEARRARLARAGKERVALFSWERGALALLAACRRVAARAPEPVRALPPGPAHWSPRGVVRAARSSVGGLYRRARHRLARGLRRTRQVLLASSARVKGRVVRCVVPPFGLHRQHRPRPLVVPRHYYDVRPPAPAPVIAIVTPSYNQAAFLPRTIESVLQQNYPRLEYVVQDGGSTDDTGAILERYRRLLTHCESRGDRGQAEAINLGFGHTTGEIMAYLNSDDLLLPGALAAVAGCFAAHPEVDVVYGHRIIIDDHDREVGRWVLPPHDGQALLWLDYVPQETLFWRRRLWEQVGGRLDEDLQFALDWDLLIRFQQAGARFVRLPRFLAAFRVHPAQKTNARLVEVGAREVRWLRERCHGPAVSEQDVQRHVGPYLRRQAYYHALHRLGLLAG
jgi:glycosyltransferase involved in cell wall biosynthesis/GT2 family glycosyltransferase